MVASFVNWNLNGISDASNYPPQNGLAVGPSYVVTAESSKLEWTNLSTGVTSAPLSFYSSALFGSTGVTSIYDARLAYDSSTGYYVLSAVVLNSDGSYGLDFAVATNPNATWTVANLAVSPNLTGTPSSPDMPDISVGGGKIYVTTAQDSPGLAGTAQWIVPESSVAAGGSITGLAANVDPGADGIMRPATGVAGSATTTYYFGANTNGTQVVLTYQTYDATSGYSAVKTLSPGNANVGNNGNNFAASQNGTALQIDALDSRVQNLAYGTIHGKNYVFGVSEVQPSSTSQPAVEWFQYDVSNPSSPLLAGHGEITGSSTGLGASVAIFNPSIAVNAAGDVLINFTASSSTTFPSDYYVVAGPNLTFGAPTLYQASTSFFESSATATGLQRWGTYSSAVADPNNPNGFWISNEYVSDNPDLVNIPTGSGVNAWWGTATAQVTVDLPPTVTITSAAEASNEASQTITGMVTSGGGTVVGQTVTLTDNGVALTTSAPIIVQAGGAFTANVTLPNQGANSIVASVTDSLGVKGTSAAVVDTLDNIAPTIAITSAAEASNEASQTITGTVTSGGAALVVGQTVTLTDNGVALTTSAPIIVQAGGTFTANVTLPNQGANSIVASVTDSYGNKGTSAAVVDTLDNIAPTIAITSAAEASEQPSQTIAGTVTSGGAALVVGQTVTLTDKGVALTTSAPIIVQAGGTFTANVTLPNQGANSIVASVTDSYGNKGTSAAVVDTLYGPPTISGTHVATTTTEAAVKPFTGVTIADPNANASDTLTITLSNSGAGGTLSGTGLSGGTGGVYTLSGSAAAVTSALDALTFTPTAGQAHASTATTFTLSDKSSAFATATLDSATTVIDIDPVQTVHANDISRSGEVTGPYNFIDLLNLEASYSDLIHAFGTNAQAMQNWYNGQEPIEHRADTFDGLDYIASYGDLINAFKSAGSEQAVLDDGATHFIDAGYHEGRTTTFNGLDYIASYGDLINAFGANGDAGAYHYIESGASEGRKMTFDGLDYIASYGDLINAFGANERAGAEHFIDNGYKEGRTTTFNGLDYIASYSDLIQAFGANNDAGASHYIENGASEGRTTTFDGLDYIASYGDLIKALGANEQAGAEHFIDNGHKEGRTTTFDGLDYIAGYTDLMTAFGANNDAGATHYITNGLNEGRNGQAFDVAAYETAHSDLIGKYASNDAFLTAYITTYATTGKLLT